MRDQRQPCGRHGCGVEPVILAVDLLVLEAGTGQGEAPPDLSHGQGRPPGEVLDLSGTVAAVVAGGELRQRLLAVQPPGGGCALGEQCVGELLAPPRPAGDDAQRLGR